MNPDTDEDSSSICSETPYNSAISKSFLTRTSRKTHEIPNTFTLRTLMECYSNTSNYNGILTLPLTKWRQLCKDLGIFDNGKVNMGDVNVAYQSAIKHHAVALHQGRKGTLRQIEDVLWEPLKWPKRSDNYGHQSLDSATEGVSITGGGGSMHSEKVMAPSQFRAALVEIASLYYHDMIVKLNVKGMNTLHMSDTERRACEEAAFEVMYNKKILGHVEKKCNFTDDEIHQFDYVTQLLLGDEVQAAFRKELFALTNLHDRYSESERIKKAWATKHGRESGAGATNRANLKLMTFKELTTMLQDFGAIPHFIKVSQVFHLFRQLTRRTLSAACGDDKDKESSGVVLGESDGKGMNTHVFRLSKDRKGRNWRSVTLAGMENFQEDEHMEVFRPDFLNFSQYCEILGHIAMAAFNHDKAEDRVIMLWKWFDQSAPTVENHPNKISADSRYSVPIRFSSRSDH